MISDKTLEFIKNKLIEYNKAFGHLEDDDFLTFGYIWTSEDGMGMLHSSSIHSFKTLDGLAKYIYNYIADVSNFMGRTKNLDISTVSEWLADNLSFNKEVGKYIIYNEEVGKYIIYIDSFTEGNLKVTDKIYNTINNTAGDDLDANANKVDNAYDEVMSSLDEEEQNIWQINSFLEDLDINFAKINGKKFITAAYIHTIDDGAGMITAGGYTNFKTLGDVAEFINELYKDNSYGDSIDDWLDNNITVDADKPGMYAVYIRSFED